MDRHRSDIMSSRAPVGAKKSKKSTKIFHLQIFSSTSISLTSMSKEKWFLIGKALPLSILKVNRVYGKLLFFKTNSNFNKGWFLLDLLAALPFDLLYATCMFENLVSDPELNSSCTNIHDLKSSHRRQTFKTFVSFELIILA